jgi:hypothetical protein
MCEPGPGTGATPGRVVLRLKTAHRPLPRTFMRPGRVEGHPDDREPVGQTVDLHGVGEHGSATIPEGERAGVGVGEATGRDVGRIGVDPSAVDVGEAVTQ